MGARKHNTAEAMKEARKNEYFAKLNNVPTSPRKMRLVADMIRGLEVNRALGALHFSTKEASRALEKVLKSAIANWEVKTGKKADSETLYVSKVMVDGGMMLKRLQ
ncbi:MAG: 50S ribosomal protein L22, partial [Paludibacteraceae bacterium]|nr:50S ribosomal protein L22 [Paludibacteraceae bacterium]